MIPLLKEILLENKASVLSLCSVHKYQGIFASVLYRIFQSHLNMNLNIMVFISKPLCFRIPLIEIHKASQDHDFDCQSHI